MDISQDTIANAGLSPKVGDMIGADVMRAYGQKGAALKDRAAALGKVSELSQEKAAAEAPKMDEMAKAAEEPPPTAPAQEKIADYQKPQLQPKETQEAFGQLLAMSMLVGLGSRTPFYAAMEGMTGAMKGFQTRDDQLVEQSLKSYNAQLAAIKERNDAAREDFDAAWKKWSGNLPRLKQELEIIGAKYDLPIATENARVASIDSAVKEFDNTIKSGETALTKLDQLAQKAQHDHEVLVETKARDQAAAQARTEAHQDRMAIAAMRNGANGTGGGGAISPQYSSDPEYKKRVDTWAKMVKSAVPLPARFAQMVGKQMAGDVFKVAGDADAGDMVANRISQRELTSEAAKIGTQSASVAIANKEMEKFIPIAEKAIDAVPRTGWRPINQLIQAGENTWSPEQGALVIANRSLQTAYAQLIQRGAPTVHSSAEAEAMLNSADSPAAYKAKMKQLVQEGMAAEQSLRDAQKDLTDKARTMGNGGEARPPAASAAQPYSDPDKERRYQEWKRSQGAGGGAEVSGTFSPRAQ